MTDRTTEPQVIYLTPDGDGIPAAWCDRCTDWVVDACPHYDVRLRPQNAEHAHGPDCAWSIPEGEIECRDGFAYSTPESADSEASR